MSNGARERRQYASQAEAETALDEYRENERNPKPAPHTEAHATASMTFGQAVDRYLAEKVRKRSLFADRRITTHLKEVFGADTPLADITANRISEYKAKRLTTTSDRRKDVNGAAVTLSSAAVNRPLTILRHLLRLAHEEWGVLNTTPKIRLEKEPQGRLRWLTQEEATKLLAVCKKSRNAALADLVEFALFTGVRKGEARSA